MSRPASCPAPSDPTFRHRRPTLRSFAVLALALGLALPGHAVRPRDGEGSPSQACPHEAGAMVDLTADDLALIGLEIGIDAEPATISESGSSGGQCTVIVHPIPQFSWQLVSKPAGSAASLTLTSTLHPKLGLDREGIYRVRFTACPNGCTIASGFGGTVSVAAKVRDITIDAQSGIAIPPETEPFVPPRPPAPRLDPGPSGCPPGADKVAAAWVPVEHWDDGSDFRTLSGRVLRSKVSRKDNILNHDSQDHNAVVEPDPAFEGLMPSGQDHVEVEWERHHYPDFFWPTHTDRIAAHGYWDHDCDHGAKTEIHPPVLTAAQRARAIELPVSLGLGTNVWVPGVITDIWVNNQAGEITRNCSMTGLHNAPFVPLPFITCLPHSQGFSRNPIRKVHTFDIHLPRNPQDIIAPVKSAPPVQLFVDIQTPVTSFGPDPVIVQDPVDSNVLRVTIDLTGHTGATYARRIVAGWAYPSPENWGLRRFKVRVDSLDVHDDADGRLRGDGDWRFWINTNNAGDEWKKIFHCNGCVHGHEDFGGRAWETDSVHGDRHFGPDLRLFPDQRILIHSGGYEEDWVWTDGTGYVTRALSQVADTYSFPSICNKSTRSGCGRYDLNVAVLGGAPVTAILTPTGEAILDAYEVTADDLTDSMPLTPIDPRYELPSEIVVEPGEAPVAVDLTTYFPTQGFENSLADIEDEAFEQQLIDLADEDPERLHALLTSLREKTDLAFQEADEFEVLLGLAVLHDLIDPALWEQYFGDFTDSLPTLPEK